MAIGDEIFKGYLIRENPTNSAFKVEGVRHFSPQIITRQPNEMEINNIKVGINSNNNNNNNNNGFEELTNNYSDESSENINSNSSGNIKSLSNSFISGLPPNKRIRRTADKIDRIWKCSYPNCDRSYGSENSLNQHIKLKHTDVNPMNIRDYTKTIKRPENNFDTPEEEQQQQSVDKTVIHTKPINLPPISDDFITSPSTSSVPALFVLASNSTDTININKNLALSVLQAQATPTITTNPPNQNNNSPSVFYSVSVQIPQQLSQFYLNQRVTDQNK